MDGTLRDLIAMRTVSGDLAAASQAVAYAARHLRSCGMHVRRYESGGFPSLLATSRPGKTPKVLLAAHLDVVSAPEELFRLRLDKGIYYGRGVWDMKFAAAVYLRLASALKGHMDDYDFGIMLTCDEEQSGAHGTGYLTGEQAVRPQVAILPDGIPAWRIQRAAKGAYFAEISVLGVSAHGSRPWEGDSASLKLIHILQRIAELFKDWQRPETMTLNIGIMQSQASINQIPDNAMATLDIRFLSLETFTPLRQKVEAICAAGDGTIRELGATRRPITCDLAHSLVKAFLKQVQLHHGSMPPSVLTNGTSDARYFSDLSIPCILLSPQGGGLHSNDEWLDAADYERYHLMLRSYVEDVARISVAAESSPPMHTLVKTG